MPTATSAVPQKLRCPAYFRRRTALGRNPLGSMVRIALGIVVFTAIFGTIFYLARSGG
ncbi:hypothetical protein [uncultured Devosia sp.]|uniref:hypothetical protein n=1 Tax=uncultured Devosia sp. TaxID=211434 RepID=UPI0035C99E35